MGSLDRSTIWPYDEHGEPRDVLLPALRQPDASPRRSRASASSTAARRCSSRPEPARRRRSCSRCSQPGDTIALAEGCYFGTGVTFQTLERWGLRFVEFDQTGPPPDGVQLVWLEAPSNPFLTMPDLEAAAAHPAPRRRRRDRRDARSTCARSSTAPTSSLHSATKYLAGHDDALLGAVVVPRPGGGRRAPHVPQRVPASSPAPDPAWLLLRGLKTLEVRVRRQTETAADLAERLRGAPEGRDRALSRASAA